MKPLRSRLYESCRGCEKMFALLKSRLLPTSALVQHITQYTRYQFSAWTPAREQTFILSHLTIHHEPADLVALSDDRNKHRPPFDPATANTKHHDFPSTNHQRNNPSFLGEWPPLPFEDYLAWGYFIEITSCWPLHADEKYESQIIHQIAGLRARLDQGYDKEYLRYHDNSGPVVFDLHATSDIPTDTIMLWEVFKLLEDLVSRRWPISSFCCRWGFRSHKLDWGVANLCTRIMSVFAR